MTRTEVVKLLAFAQALIPSFRMPTEGRALDLLVDVWERQLEDLDAGLVTATLEAAAAGEDREFVLNAAQLRHRATAHLVGQAPTGDEAWAEVREEIRRCGWASPQLVTFTHPSVAAVVSALGWQSLCESTNEIADRAHFARMYEARVERDRATIAVPPAARAVLEQHAPTAIGAVNIAGELTAPGSGNVYALNPAVIDGAGVDEPVIAQGQARQRLAATIAKLRLAQAIPDVDEPRPAFKWQEGDPIDRYHRGVDEPEAAGDDAASEVTA